MKLYCCGCQENVTPYLVSGADVLPEIKRLRKRSFWKCEECRNFVGTYEKTYGKKTEYFAPLGPIGTKKIRKTQDKLRAEIGLILKAKKDTPNAKQILYDWLSKKLFYPYRTEAIISKAEANLVFGYLNQIKEKIKLC